MTGELVEPMNKGGRITVHELGGSGDAMDEDSDTVAEFGRFALCKDDQGSSFGLHQRPA